MSDQRPVPAGAGGETDALAGGNYEVIRERLGTAGQALCRKAEALNQQRKQVFGGSELEVIATERVRTDNNCVPRDIVSIHGKLLVGYNVFIGLKSETAVSDVLAVHRFEPAGDGYDCSGLELASAAPWLCDEQFVKDFGTLYRYYREARLLQLARRETRLFAIFQVGTSAAETKVFRWRIDASGAIAYMDDRGDREYTLPPPQDFEWTPLGREHQVGGKFPHMNVENTVFVEAIGGTLTVKVENNTAVGEGVFDEPVDDYNQTLDDGQYAYARLGSLILLKVLPFREAQWRYLVYSERTHTIVRIDAIGQACLQLPEDHGILFPGGYVLQSGEHKVFEGDTTEIQFKRTIKSPNGEDVLYVFHRRQDGSYSLFPYNLIRKEVQTPLHGHGYSLFDDGRLVVFRSLSDEPTRVHPMQVWKTPFTSAEYAASVPTDGSFLAKVGNAELVRGISDALGVVRLIEASEPDRRTFEDIIATATRALDSYFWLGHEDVGDIKSELEGIRRTAELITDEFEKVQLFRRQAADALVQSEAEIAAMETELRSERWREVGPFLDALTRLRTMRGHLITLREVRYMDRARLDELEAGVVRDFERVSNDCVRFLMRDEAFAPLEASLETTLAKVEGVKKVADLKSLTESVDTISTGLGVLSEVVSNLQIDDATQRTAILEGISEVFAHANRVRAIVDGRRHELMAREGRAEFGAQFRLLGQSVASALAVCATPERCDDELGRIMVQLEELEGRFSELDEFLADLAAKREEIYEAFSARKQTLVDGRQRRAQNITKAGERILEGVGRRARTLKSTDEVNAYFASDAMVMKLRQLGEELTALGDTVKADELAARLQAARQDALRGLRDRLELFDHGEGLIKLGRHRFSVNTQPLELTMVARDGQMMLHLSGTDFHEPVADEAFAATQRFWGQDLVSENAAVYRGEFLAASMLFAADAGTGGLSMAKLHDAARAPGGLIEVVRAYAQERYDEGYERGIHDGDGALILDKLLAMRETAGLLRFAAAPRALAVLFWAHAASEDDTCEACTRWHRRAQSLGRLRRVFEAPVEARMLAGELAEAIGRFARRGGAPGGAADDGHHGSLLAVVTASDSDVAAAGAYLVEELASEKPHFVASADAVRLRDALVQDMELHGARTAFEDDMRILGEGGDVAARVALARAWVNGFVCSRPERQAAADHVCLQAAILLATEWLDWEVSSALVEMEVKELLGRHGRIKDRAMIVRLDELEARLGHYIREHVPAFRAYRKLRGELLARERQRLRLGELMPRVMSSFVRNRLINDVYLPLIGDNLAKQIGAAGEGKRTDLMGMLLLISPPGYGKTTLMEYVANRLGVVFAKVNGPSLGHAVCSLDPAEAPNATARQEVEKINLALEMGTNTMLYVDDIQHTNPELLQKFISLCDGQRKIEGVWRGKTRTYDMRGKKFCVVMAGNPYTESGESFQIPDMLSNRADVYNLGDVLAGKEELFALSYIENALTSNPTLAPLGTREQGDVYKLARMAQGEDLPTTELSHGYSSMELADILAVLRHLYRSQKVLLAVNRQYIESAAKDDRYRTKPPFKLQGSYRNMNKLAEKIVPAMTEDEVERLVDAHYQGEAQTLTTEAEQNLLELAELRDRMTEIERARWASIKAEYVRLKRMGGGDDDPVTRVTGTLTGLAEELGGIRAALRDGASRGLDERVCTLAGAVAGGLASIRDTLAQESARALTQAGSGSGHEQLLAMVGNELSGMRDILARAAADNASGALARTLGEALSRPINVRVDAPRGVEELLAQQVAIVERTLVPLVRTATQHLGDTQALEQRLGEVMGLLKQIDQRLRV